MFQTPPRGGSTTSNNDLAAGINIASITFTTGSGYTLTGNAITLTGEITANTVAAGTNTISLRINGPGGLTVEGGSEVDLANANNYTGATVINSGSLRLMADGAVPSNSAVTVASGSMFFVSGHQDTIGSLAGAGIVDLSPPTLVPVGAPDPGGSLLTNGNNASTTFSGVIRGLGDVVKQGTGTLSLTGPNTYTGSTEVIMGTLLVNGFQPSSDVTVDSGATLGGSGTVGTIMASGTVSPGSPGPGVLHCGKVTFNPGSSLLIQIMGTAPGSGGYSQLNATGTVSLSGNPTLTVTLGSFALAVGDTFMPIISTGVLTPTFSMQPENSTLPPVSGRNFRVNYQTNDVLLTLASLNSQTVVTSSVNPSVFGQAVTFTATVSAAVPPAPATPTRMVTFQDGTTTLGTGTLNANGVAMFSPTTPLSVGTHSITAVYSGDSNFAISMSTALPQIVTMASAMITVTSSANPSAFGQPVMFTATVMPVPPATGIPTGSVTFLDGGTPIGSGSLNAMGLATFATSTLTVGPHTITAQYSGDSDFIMSTSMALTQAVGLAGTTTAVSSSANPSVFGQAVTFTATVSVIAPGAGTPTGIVTFQDGRTPIGTGSLNAMGQATLTTSTLTAGPHTITAQYGGDPDFIMSTSMALTQTVGPASTTTGVTSSQNPSLFSQSVTFTTTVTNTSSGASPTGAVEFFDGTTDLGAGTPLSGSGNVVTSTFTISTLQLGSHSIKAMYSDPKGNFLGSSGSLSPDQMVNSNNNTMLLFSVNADLSITFTAEVQAVSSGVGTPTGTVTFQEGTTTLGTASLNSMGTAALTLATGAGANHSVTAVYSGDTTFNPSTSNTISPPKLFVTELYLNVLERPSVKDIDTAGLNFWVQQLENGATRAAVATGFLQCAEYRGIEVKRYYLTFLDRNPDPAGQQFWVNQLLAGVPEYQVILAFLTSPEFTAENPDNGSFVHTLYRDVLGRDGSNQEVAFWQQVLQSGARSRVAVGYYFLSSNEAFVDAIDQDYQNFLGRAADPAGLQGFLAALQSGGITPTGLAMDFIASDEYFVRSLTP
jgi:autotransporter-associated beta strand protein